MEKGFAKSLLPVSKRQEVGKHLATRFSNHHTGLTLRCSQRLDHQTANASDPAIIKHFFHMVIILQSN